MTLIKTFYCVYTSMNIVNFLNLVWNANDVNNMFEKSTTSCIAMVDRTLTRTVQRSVFVSRTMCFQKNSTKFIVKECNEEKVLNDRIDWNT